MPVTRAICGAVRTARFTIGEAFPADDPGARFVTAVAMISNDWLRSIEQMPEDDDDDPDAPGLRVMGFRRQASMFHEAAVFIRDAQKRFPEVARFIAGLEADAITARDKIVG